MKLLSSSGSVFFPRFKQSPFFSSFSVFFAGGFSSGLRSLGWASNEGIFDSMKPHASRCKCLHCKMIFVPDYRNRGRQKYCSGAECGMIDYQTFHQIRQLRDEEHLSAAQISSCLIFGHFFLARMGLSSQSMSMAKLCMRRKKTLAATVPLCITWSRSAGGVVINGTFQIAP